jgi:hypothetical protein
MHASRAYKAKTRQKEREVIYTAVLKVNDSMYVVRRKVQEHTFSVSCGIPMGIPMPYCIML